MVGEIGRIPVFCTTWDDLSKITLPIKNLYGYWNKCVYKLSLLKVMFDFCGISFTSPKTNGWIPKRMVWKRWLLLYMAILVSMFNFWWVKGIYNRISPSNHFIENRICFQFSLFAPHLHSKFSSTLGPVFFWGGFPSTNIGQKNRRSRD